MQDTSVASGVRVRFRPTWQQALARGALTGVAGSVVLVLVNAVVAGACQLFGAVEDGPGGAWLLLVLGPPVLGTALGLAFGRFFGTDVDGTGIRQVPGPAAERYSWAQVVELRAERHRARTVVALYLDTGEIVHLRAPYDGGFLGADPAFERRLFLLHHLWRSHRIGGVAA